jgi:hypothetical protein
MNLSEIIGGTLNVGLLALFYTIFGAFISYLIFHLFDDYDKEWENSGLLYQTADVSAELSLVGIIAFWTTYIIRENPPIFQVSVQLDRDVDTYISGLFFAFAMFMFLEDLSTKIKFLYEKFLKVHFVRIFPEKWSIIKSIFGSRKTEQTKNSVQHHTWSANTL